MRAQGAVIEAHGRIAVAGCEGMEHNRELTRSCGEVISGAGIGLRGEIGGILSGGGDVAEGHPSSEAALHTDGLSARRADAAGDLSSRRQDAGRELYGTIRLPGNS